MKEKTKEKQKGKSFWKREGVQGYAPIPKGSVKAAESYDTVGWVSPKDLKYPDETWELMKFMSSEMYETVLTKTPVAACAHAASADVFYNLSLIHI